MLHKCGLGCLGGSAFFPGVGKVTALGVFPDLLCSKPWAGHWASDLKQTLFPSLKMLTQPGGEQAAASFKSEWGVLGGREAGCRVPGKELGVILVKFTP